MTASVAVVEGRTSNTPPAKCIRAESVPNAQNPPSRFTGARCVGYGIDTAEWGLHASLAKSGDRTLWQNFDSLKTQAQAGLKPVVHFGGGSFEVLPSGGGSVYAWKLQNEHFGISVGRHEPGSTPTLAMRPECAFLWDVGIESAWLAAQDLGQAVDVDGARPEGCLSRIDLAADFQGIDFAAAIREHFVSRARKDRERGLLTGTRRGKGAQKERARVLDVAAPRDLEVGESGTVYERETLTFGSGGIVVRIYNKTREIRDNGNKKRFFPERVWPLSECFNQDEDVWRVEVQLRREVLKEIRVIEALDYGVEGPEHHVRMDEISGLLACLPSWWRYVVGADQGEGGWVSWRVPSETEPQRTRWKAHASWSVVRAVPWLAPRNVAGVRKSYRDAKAERLEGMAVGCMASVAALRGHINPMQVLDDFAETFLKAMSEASVKPGALRGYPGMTPIEKGFFSVVGKKARRLNLEHEFVKETA